MPKKKKRRRTGPHANGSGSAAEIGARGKWTATGSARSARTARIATAAHLRHADVACRWEVTRLVSALDVWRKHLTAQARELTANPDQELVEHAVQGLLFGGSGLSRPYPSRLEDAARAVLSRRADDLDAATLYVLAPSMCDVVIAAAQTLSLGDLGLIDPDDLPSPTGMLLLPFPILVRAVNGSLADDRAYVWHTPAHLEMPTPTGESELRPAVRLTAYMDSHGPVRPDSFRDMAAVAAAEGNPLPPLLPDGTRTLPFRATVTDSMRNALSAYADRARNSGERWREINTAMGFNEGDQVDASFEYRPGDEINDTDDTFATRFLYAFWRLCTQKIAQVDDVPTNHSAHVQAERAGVAPDVRVVTIRPTARAADPDAPAARGWQHRWVVRMHKVRQWYPTEQRHKILYRGPYIKGPADKPLLGGDVVRSVTR
jgi:hypothetical protein